MFKSVSNHNSAVGTSLKGYVSLRYKDIVKIFGEPQESDNYKVTGEWVFLNEETNEVFTLYDWKRTNLYSVECPSVEEFRNYNEKVSFNVGGKVYAGEFIAWLERAVNDGVILKSFEEIILNIKGEKL
jgi:hypothetical protein